MLETYQELRKISAIALLDNHELEIFHRLLHPERFSPRCTIIKQGMIEPAVFFLTRGHVNVTRETPEGEVFLTVLHSGTYFGEAAIFNDQTRSATVRSVDEVEVYVVTRDQFKALMIMHPAIASKVLFGMFREHLERLQRTSGELMSRHTFFSRHSLNSLFT